MSKIKDLTTALRLFEEAATKHAESTEQGDYKTANQNYDVIIDVINFLKKENQILVLQNFFSHSSEGVRSWAATYLLPVEEKNAIKVLEDIARGSSIRALAAETTLSEWRSGDLIL